MGALRTGSIFMLLVLSAAVAQATSAQMDKLPVSVPYQCATCHLSQNPVSADLNPFGTDFEGNLERWNQTLAAMDSDGDGCTNGVELGDVDGDGSPDVGVEAQSSNPGVDGDCSSASTLNNKTWGELKAMFDGRR